MDPVKEAAEALQRTKGGVTLARDVVIGLIEAARRQDMWHANKEPEEESVELNEPEEIEGQELEFELPQRMVEVEWETESSQPNGQRHATRARLVLGEPTESEVYQLTQVLRD